MELMQQWSEWQARKQHTLTVLLLTTMFFFAGMVVLHQLYNLCLYASSSLEML
jgi:ABC-type amino acid transport system permease subunit